MDTWERLALMRDFPDLNWETFDERSKETIDYNCIAFAAGDTSRRWWPNLDGHYWPSEDQGVPQEETIPAFIAAYRTLGYVPCDGGDLENGFERIALYADSAMNPKHAAHQLRNGRWESKLGAGIDIWHDSLAELNGPIYGKAVRYLKRKIQTSDYEDRNGRIETGTQLVFNSPEF